MKSAVYEILNASSGRLSIGSSVDYRKRFAHHRKLLRKGNHGNKHLQRSWDRYGEVAFSFFPVEYCEPENLISTEQFWIDSLGAVKHGYNQAPVAGSCLGIKRGPLTEEHKRKISRAMVGTTNAGSFKPGLTPWIKGKKHSPETRAKISAIHKGKTVTFSPEHRAKISKANTGRKFSPEHIQKLRDSHAGIKPPPKTADGRRRLSEAAKKRWADPVFRKKMATIMAARKWKKEVP